jgi:H+/Cl- antiporter ClcA
MVKGDFTANARLLWLAGLAIPIGGTCAFVAYGLQRLIALFTNIFYYQNFHVPAELIPAAKNTLGWVAIFVPVVGGLIIGLMARYGSEKIRGHGIPEALEAILFGGSRMEPRLAVLKPLSSAISIGSGGPFGAEGPIIMTGGACGSIFAQIFRLTPAERKTLLVAGAAGGMSATFGTPIAAVLLAVELLLFEWKPRSLIPVAIASALAAMLRPFFFGTGATPMIPVPAHVFAPTFTLLWSAVLVGLSGGLLSLVLTSAVHASEDVFHRLPIHWMWWPAIGGLVVGIGGYFEPKALGVGYQVIIDVLQGNFLVKALLGLMVVKGLIWAIALGSGTSGGVLAPLMMTGAMLGALEATVLPGHDVRLWSLACLAAVLGGSMRAPLTGVLFALETTYDMGAVVPLLIASTAAYGFTVLVMKRSILTEKIARRGLHLSQEYSVDPLEMLSVGEVMTTLVVSVQGSLPIQNLVLDYFVGPAAKRHQGYPVLDDHGSLLGVVTKADLLDEWIANRLVSGDANRLSPIITYDVVNRAAITAMADETCRTAAQRMAQLGIGRLIVVDPNDPERVVGILARADLLKSRARLANEEIHRERFLGAGLPRFGMGRGKSA